MRPGFLLGAFGDAPTVWGFDVFVVIPQAEKKGGDGGLVAGFQLHGVEAHDFARGFIAIESDFKIANEMLRVAKTFQ